MYGGDHLVSGDGIDYLSGGGNNDTMNSCDGGPDIVTCGLGGGDRVDAEPEDDVVETIAKTSSEKANRTLEDAEQTGARLRASPRGSQRARA